MKHLFAFSARCSASLKAFIIAIFFAFVSHPTAHSAEWTFKADASTLENLPVRHAVEDASSLLAQALRKEPALNNTDADIIISIPAPVYFPDHMDSIPLYENFSWKKIRQGQKTVLQLEAHSPKGIANGIYALLQEALGFRFYHPRATIIPDLTSYDPGSFQDFEAALAFRHNGFHLHTMHPLELTQCILDEKHPGALASVEEYIRWLARNYQNYWEFYLLESINKKTWQPHAQAFNRYARERGISPGVQLSMHMIQQKAFQLYQTFPATLKNKEEQIIGNLDFLIDCGFELISIEPTTTEFSAGNIEEKKQLFRMTYEHLYQKGIKMTSNYHVVKQEKMISGSGGGDAILDILHPDQGILVHSVMFYSLLDEKAPVYENPNLSHMHQLLLDQKDQRETWYYPENAYWVTFDNTVPMTLFPYLQARLQDIEHCDSLNINGNLTFSSGWEWSYWLFDWSVARWNWNFSQNGQQQKKYPLQYAHELITTPGFKDYFNYHTALQQEYIKDKELIRVMDAQTVTDELPFDQSLELHPRPKYSYPYIRNKATLEELEEVEQLYLDPLKAYLSKAAEKVILTALNPVEQEWKDGIDITYLRAQHRLKTLSYLVSIRKAKLLKEKKPDKTLLEEAARIRGEALKIVRKRESAYRYPLEELAGTFNSHTCYDFGYLYTVHHLHFWEREELQAYYNRYKFWHWNIWNIWKNIGVIN